MGTKDIVCAWKDSDYRHSLSASQRALLPPNPIGESLSGEELLTITAGAGGGCETDVMVGICSCSDPYATATCTPSFPCLPL